MSRTAAMSTKSHVVVVTGGSGFVGQHVIKHLELYAPFVTEIRVLDVVPYIQKLTGFSPKIPVYSHVSDINNEEKVAAVLKEADSVLHLASVIDSRFHPNVNLLYKVNVEGTKTIIKACVKENIPHLVYCGSITSYQGWDEVKDGNENTIKHRKDCIIRDYGTSKAIAERLVLEANGMTLQNGNKLKTLAVVPSTMYGELDANITTILVQSAKASGGTLPRLGNGKVKEQYSYVGNVAWGIVCALKTFQEDEGKISGQNFFLNDDTPLKSSQVLLEPVLHACGCKLSNFHIPFWLLFFLVAIFQVFCILISPLKHISSTLSLSAIKFQMTNFYVNHNKAETMLNYKPLYTFEDSLTFTKNWAKDNFLNNDEK